MNALFIDINCSVQFAKVDLTMKILVLGAGVLVCNLTRNLFRAGKDVTLLARRKWAEEIQKNGLRIKDKFSPRTPVTRISVVTELNSKRAIGCNHCRPALYANRLDSGCTAFEPDPKHHFVGNNVRARAIAASQPKKTVLFAFSLSAGHRGADHAAFVLQNRRQFIKLKGNTVLRFAFFQVHMRN